MSLARNRPFTFALTGIDDPEMPLVEMNFVDIAESEYGEVIPLRLPWAKAASLHYINSDQGLSDALDHEKLRDVRSSAAMAYSEKADAKIPDGTAIPGVMVDDTIDAAPTDVEARGSWAAGRWILEMRRSLEAGENDIAVEDGVMLWFAAFDHSTTRHTYHQRPLVVEMQ